MMSITEDFNSKFGDFAKLNFFGMSGASIGINGKNLWVGCHGNNFYALLDGSEYLTPDNCDTELRPLVLWCREKLIEYSGKDESYFRRTFQGDPLEEEQEEEEEFEEETEEHWEMDYEQTIKSIEDPAKQKFERQNFQIRSLEKFLYRILHGNQSFLTIVFDYGLEQIDISLKLVGDDLKSLNDLVKINDHRCEFRSLERFVPVDKLHDFEKIFRWCLKTIEIFTHYDLIFYEDFSISNEVFNERSKNIIHEKFVIDKSSITCYSNEGGDYGIHFTDGKNIYSFQTTKIVAPGMYEIEKGKFVQETNIDFCFPMHMRKRAIEIVKLCANLVGYEKELTFDIERKTTEFEKRASAKGAICVYENLVIYRKPENNRITTYDFDECPRNKTEKKFRSIRSDIKCEKAARLIGTKFPGLNPKVILCFMDDKYGAYHLMFECPGKLRFVFLRSGTIQVSGLHCLDDGKIIPNVYMDKYIPAEKKQMICEVIKFCANYVEIDRKITFEFDRELTKFEKELAKNRNDISHVIGDDVYYFKNFEQIVKFNVHESPRNKIEEVISEIYKRS